MEQLKGLRRKRGSVKARVAAFRNYVEIIEEKVVSEQRLTDSEAAQLSQRLDRIGEAFSDFDRYQTDVEMLVEDQDLEASYAERVGFENSYFEIIAKAQSILDRRRKSERPDERIEGMGTGTGSLRECELEDGVEQGARKYNIERGAGGHVKLPVLRLPEFDGSYHKWLAFYDTFRAVIHTNDSISAVQKFQYLSNSLKGDASQVIEGLEISAINYNSAWELLEKRYQNRALMVHNHIRGIVEYPRLGRQSFSLLRGLLNAMQGHMRALMALEQAVNSWDSLLIYIITDKFDVKTKMDWEKWQAEQNDSPKVTNLIEFIEKQCQLLERTDRSLRDSADQPRNRDPHRQNQGRSSTHSCSAAARSDCPICKGSHHVFQCKTFLDMSVPMRISEVKRKGRCLNCLRDGHLAFSCKAQACRKCHKRHNTLLHIGEFYCDKGQNNNKNSSLGGAVPDEQSTDDLIESSANFAGSGLSGSHVLPTAIVRVMDGHGVAHECTVLLDSGSQSNFITKKISKKLGLVPSSIQLNVIGVNQCRSNISEVVQAVIKSRHGNYEASLSFLVSEKITSIIPGEPINISKWAIPKHIVLADPHFQTPKEIDMLLGVEVFWELLCPDSTPHPFLHKTKLGFVVSGRVPRHGRFSGSTACNVSTDCSDLSGQLRRFWELEECPKQEEFSAEEKACEDIFVKTVRWNEEGRFVVTIPLKGSLDSLGKSRAQADRRFVALEQKLERNELMKHKYVEFMRQYEKLNHMTRVVGDCHPEHSYYLPHHGVLKENSLTTKLRVVFDGSAPSDSGVSINQLQIAGPTLQQDLLSIILRFRMHPYVVGADVSMMYRQILVEPEQRPLQRILWRSDSSQPVEIFDLNTVTYGLASSSFLAIRCLFELANEFEDSHPKAAEIIRRSMYVDDLLYGAQTKNEAIQIGKEVSHILESAGLQLRKWISNDRDILGGFEDSGNELEHHIVNLGEGETVKTLGLSWSVSGDELMYGDLNNFDFDSTTWTKRSILSTVARIYDALGLLGPCIILAKMVLQRLWRDGSAWDQPASPEVLTMWESYWPISGRSLARKVVHDCVRCAKSSPRPFSELMGDLPRDRVTPARAFHVTGVDYAGPFAIKDRKGRGGKVSKCYVALFICFASKAVHLELVSDLTTGCFILALRRFASRWGMPATIWSDNGTNFVGASSELRELGSFLRNNEGGLAERLIQERFNWRFIPAYSPHFGGIWEAGVKSTKFHLKRVLGNALLTFEEFYSVLAQIGAILNSRPLTPLSASPLDLQPLTPAHLLVGGSLTSVPDPDVTGLPEGRLSRYQRIQQIQQNFWSRWSKEYISELQARTKWRSRKQFIRRDMLVLVKDDNLPPMRWRLGRVEELHPGKDSIVRVASVRTRNGIIKRAITRLCPLPVESSI